MSCIGGYRRPRALAFFVWGSNPFIRYPIGLALVAIQSATYRINQSFDLGCDLGCQSSHVVSDVWRYPGCLVDWLRCVVKSPCFARCWLAGRWSTCGLDTQGLSSRYTGVTTALIVIGWWHRIRACHKGIPPFKAHRNEPLNWLKKSCLD